MSKYNYSNLEKRINSVLKHQDNKLNSIKTLDMSTVDICIEHSEEILRILGYEDRLFGARNNIAKNDKKVLIVPSWEQLCVEAENAVGKDIELESIFTPEELQSNEKAVQLLNNEFNQIHKLDKFDICICAIAGIIGAAVDILLVGIPQKGYSGLEAGKLSDFIRKKFDEKFPQDEMEKLANSKVSKVPYDAQDNRHTGEYVAGLSAYYHRLLSLGHDPLLGFIFGVFDILTGRMTTIDKAGKVVSQVMENYSDRKESDIFAAIAKQIIHFKSDITTSMGLPAPLMSLFSFLQFGSIGEEDNTIAEIVQGMYYEGYDFIHFCSMSVPTMIVEVIIRLGYAIKRIKEGYSLKNSIPVSLNRDKHPKLSTMLFIGHSAATAVNAGKVYFTGNPMAINYPQWIAFAKYSYKQLKWVIFDKPNERDKYVLGTINEELKAVYDEVDETLNDIANDYILVFDDSDAAI